MDQPVDHHLVVTGGQLGHRWYTKFIDWTESYADKKAAGLKPTGTIKQCTSQDADHFLSTNQAQNKWCQEAMEQKSYSDDNFLFQTNTHEKWSKGSDHMYNNKSRELLQNLDPGMAVKWMKYKKPPPKRVRTPVEPWPHVPRPVEKPPPTPPPPKRPDLPIGWKGPEHTVKEVMRRREKLGDMVINPIPPRSRSAHVLMDESGPLSDIEMFRTWLRDDPKASTGLQVSRDRNKNALKQGLGQEGYWYNFAQ